MLDQDINQLISGCSLFLTYSDVSHQDDTFIASNQLGVQLTAYGNRP